MLGQNEAHLAKCTLGMLFGCFLFYFFLFLLYNIYESLKSTTRFWRKWHWSLIYYTNTILKVLYYKNNFLFAYQKTQTRISYYSCAFWTLPFGFIFIDIPHFDNDYHNFVFYKSWELFKMLCSKLYMTKLLLYCPLIIIFKFPT